MTIFFKKLVSAIAFFGIYTVTIAQPALNDSIISTQPAIQNFSSIRIQGDFEVLLTQGSTESIKIEGPAYIVNDMVVERSGQELNIKLNRSIWPWKSNSWYKKSREEWNWNNGDRERKKVTVYITAKNLDGISMSGSGHIYFKDGLTTGNLRLHVSGSGHIEGQVQANDITSKISGNGNINLAGNAESSDVRISGSGSFSAAKLVTSNSKVHISGSGHANVNANKALTASISGSAHVGYTGNVTSINTSKSGSGSITRM